MYLRLAWEKNNGHFNPMKKYRQNNSSRGSRDNGDLSKRDSRTELQLWLNKHS